jgi:ferredoxin-NADP reductase/fatty acid desaturase
MERKFYIPEIELKKFEKELEELYIKTKEKLGQEDLDHIQKIIQFSKDLEISGRSLIHLSKDPYTWVLGVLLLGYHYLIEFTELGHNILHGQYDSIPNHQNINSKNWKWDNTMDETDWKFEHHSVHHPFTNILGKDNDFGFLTYRVNVKQDWKLYHLFQVPMLLGMPLINSLFFPWYVSTSRAIAEDREICLDTYIPSIKKLAEHIFKNYIFYPLLPTGNYFKIVLGNFTAKLFQNIYLEMILAISHLHKDAFVFEMNTNETKGEYYLRQILSTVNFDSSPPYDIVYGAINLHIEHHLFPDLPPNRLREIAPEVKNICDRYGIPYRTNSFFKQFIGVIENAFNNSFPIEEKDKGDFSKFLLNPTELLDRIIKGTNRTLRTNSYTNRTIYTSQIIEIKKPIGDSGILLSFNKPKEWSDFSWREGSYLSLELEIKGERFVRQYSILEADSNSKQLSIIIKRIPDGIVSNFINDNLKKGESLNILGRPNGEFHLNSFTNLNTFVAAGVGITPIFSMLMKLKNLGKLNHSKLIYFNKNIEQTLLYDELNKLEELGFGIAYYFDELKQSSKKNFYLKEESFNFLESISLDSDFYICAPNLFLDKIKAELIKNKIPSDRIFTENFKGSSIRFFPERETKFHTVFLKTSNKKFTINENTSLLEGIEKSGVKIPFGCKKGVCKSCQVTKLEGTHECSGVVFTEKARITTCNTIPLTDIILEV